MLDQALSWTSSSRPVPPQRRPPQRSGLGPLALARDHQLRQRPRPRRIKLAGSARRLCSKQLREPQGPQHRLRLKVSLSLLAMLVSHRPSGQLSLRSSTVAQGDARFSIVRWDAGSVTDARTSTSVSSVARATPGTETTEQALTGFLGRPLLPQEAGQIRSTHEVVTTVVAPLQV